LYEQISARQLAEWEVYNRIDPIGEERQDFRMSYLASLVTNLVISTMGKKGAKLTNIKDFLLVWDEKPKQEQSTEDMRNILMGMVKK